MASGDELVVRACEEIFPIHKNACNHFVSCVARELLCDYLGDMNANMMCDYFDNKYDGLDDGFIGAYEARYLAADGWLVLVGRRAEGHGHVGIITGAELHEKYNDPFLYCGSISAYQSQGNKCVREIFGTSDVSYWVCPTRPRKRWKDV